MPLGTVVGAAMKRLWAPWRMTYIDEVVAEEAVEQREDGRVALVARAYVPRTGEEEKLGILGSDVGELIATIDHNLTHPPEEARFQRKVAYDNLPSEFLPQLRELAFPSAQELLERLDAVMARHDR